MTTSWSTICVRRTPPRHNGCHLYKFRSKGAAKREDSGKVRTIIQEQSGGAVAAAGERGGRIGGAAGGCWGGDAWALAGRVAIWAGSRASAGAQTTAPAIVITRSNRRFWCMQKLPIGAKQRARPPTESTNGHCCRYWFSSTLGVLAGAAQPGHFRRGAQDSIRRLLPRSALLLVTTMSPGPAWLPYLRASYRSSLSGPVRRCERGNLQTGRFTTRDFRALRLFRHVGCPGGMPASAAWP